MISPPTSRVTVGRRLRVSMLTGCDPAAVYMIGQLRYEGLLDDVYRIVWTPPPRQRSVIEKLRRVRLRKLGRRVQDRLDERRFEILLGDTSRALFGTDEPPQIEVTDTVQAHQINGAAFAARLAASPPDVLLVNGAPILKPHIFEQARLSAVNCHFGIAPEYRGSFTLFWPLYRRDYEHVGVTLHHLTSGLDAGPVVGHGYPALEPGDTEGSVMAKCAQIATELFIDYADAIGRGRVLGVPQANSGRTYRKRDRTGLHDARLWLERTLGLNEPPVRPPRRVLMLQ